MTVAIEFSPHQNLTYSLGEVERSPPGRFTLPETSPKAKWVQFGALITIIVSAIFLSLLGALPAAIAITAAVTVILGTLTGIAFNILLKLRGKTEDKNGQYFREINQMHPVVPCVVIPIGEEVVFRAGIQGGLQWSLKRLLPAITCSILGVQMPLASVIAIVAASIIFGASHAINDHKDAVEQSIAIAIGSIFVEGALFYFYGFWASCFAHIINNTLATFSMHCQKAEENQPLVRPAHYLFV